jgi:hypothetical protein
MAPLKVVEDYSTGVVRIAALLTSPHTVSLPTPVSTYLPRRLEDPGQLPRSDVDKAPLMVKTDNFTGAVQMATLPTSPQTVSLPTLAAADLPRRPEAPG